MCGPTTAQQQLQTEQMQFYQTMQQMTQQQYQNQQEIYKPLAAQFQSIFNLGPSQEGFSAAEQQTLNAQAIEGTAENYAAAAKAVNEGIAAEGGGNQFMPSGAADELRQEVAQSAAKQESAEETQIKEANYTQGYNEWKDAQAGLEAIAAGQNPLGYSESATSAGSAAGTTANQIAQANNSWINAALGAAGSIGSAAVFRES